MARLGQARRGKVFSRRGGARPGSAWRDEAGQGMVFSRHGLAGHGGARRGREGLGGARLGRAWPGKVFSIQKGNR